MADNRDVLWLRGGYPKSYFYRTVAGAEVDLVEIRPDRKPILYEMKHSLSPSPSRGLRSAIGDLAPDAVYLVHPGPESYPIKSGISVLSLLAME